MKKGWYKNSPLKQLIDDAKEWATQMGYEGQQHRDEVSKVVIAGMEYIS